MGVLSPAPPLRVRARLSHEQGAQQGLCCPSSHLVSVPCILCILFPLLVTSRGGGRGFVSTQWSVSMAGDSALPCK